MPQLKNTPFSIILAWDQNRGIGKDNSLPWDLPGDLKYFRKVTSETTDPNKQNAVIMGRKTWESIPEQYRPFKNRLNIVVSRNPDYELPAGVELVSSFDNALQVAQENSSIETIFNIGGGAIFRIGLEHPALENIYITEIDANFDCDTFLPELPGIFKKMEEEGPHNENGTSYSFTAWARAN